MLSFKQYVENQAQIPDIKPRNGLADPDPGQLKEPHKPDNKDLELAKQAVQLIMNRSAKWHRTIYKFLRRCGDKIPEVGHAVDNMSKPRDYDKYFGLGIGKQDIEPDVLSPNSADGSPSYYQK